MKPRQQVSRAAVELIKTFEGHRKKAAQLPDGRWTLGYGHTLTARQGAEVSEPDAEALLLYDLIGVAHAINEAVFTPLTQNQFDALVCFAFNIGVENFRRSAVLRRVNEGQLLQAAYAMELWRRADFEGERIVVDALVRRRAAEKALFLTPPSGWTPAPSQVLPPKIDLEVEAFAPRDEPAEVRASLDGPLALAERLDAAVGPDDGPSAAEAAAAAVGARLQNLLPDREPASEPSSRPAEPELELPAPEPASGSAVEGWSTTLRTLDSDSGADGVADPLPLAEASMSSALLDIADGGRGAGRDGGLRGGWLMLLALVGLAVFAGGVFQGLNASTGPGGGLSAPAAVGWGVALVGAVVFGLASYGLLRSLGLEDDVED